MDRFFIALCATVFLAFTEQDSFAQATKVEQRTFTLKADGNAFMCPFLSPMFIRNLERTGDCKVWKTEDLVIYIRCGEESKLTPEKILELAEKTGYAKELIHFDTQQKDEKR